MRAIAFNITSNLVRKLSSFTYLNITQFLGALNDNIYKLLLVYFFIQLDGIESSHKILATTGAIFVLPFLLFSATSGTLADRFSKRNIIVMTKILELFCMIGGIFAFHFESKIGSYFVLFMMATQSALFGPSKYGIVPELVSNDKIPSANGLMTSFTFLAIILGTFLASFVLDITGRHFIVAAFFCSLISVVGLITSFCIEYTSPSGSSKRFNFLFINEIFRTLKFISGERPLIMAVLGSSFFLFLGSFVQLNMIPFAVQSLHLSDVQGGYLFLLTALGIGSGAVIAGKISGKIIELGLPPLAGFCVAICCFMLDLFSDDLIMCIPLVALLGMFGGMYQIPLDSYIQIASPKKQRGQVLAATNFVGFFGVLMSSGLLYLITEIFGFNADKGFTIIGCITLGVTALFTFQFFDYLSRFIGSILCHLHFQTTFTGLENIPVTPAIYICTHMAWNDTLLMLGAQRRRMRFFIEHEQEHSKWMKRLYSLLRVVLIPPIEPLEKNEECLNTIKQTLKKGISVCIFTNNDNICDEIEKLKHSYSFREILETTHYPMIPVAIEKGEKNKLRSRLIMRLFKKFRVPAAISFGSLISGPFPPIMNFEETTHESLIMANSKPDFLPRTNSN
jgi:acyl-[acyl-carrier-protein]-phospholipid O-acyltransferase / long-chain-fatty-acid--[acyl-carrier-protein] ligase